MSELKDNVVNTLASLIVVMMIVIPIACGSYLFIYLGVGVISAVISLVTIAAIFVLEVLAIIALM